MRKFSQTVFLFCCICGFCIYDGMTQSSITLEYSPAKFVQHSKKANFKTPSSSNLWGMQWRIDKYWNHQWQAYWHYPEVNLHLVFMDYGNVNVLGYGYGIFPSIGFKIVQTQKYRFNFRLGSGIVYITKRYQKLTNPENTAIGSNLNNITQITFGNKFSLSPTIDINADLHFTHASNAATTTPNAGTNIVGVALGLTKKFGSFDEKHPINTPDTIQYKRWFFDGHYGYGLSEYSFTGGPKFGVDVINLGLGYRWSPYLHVLGGGEYEFRRSTYQFYYHDFETKESARTLATRYSVYGAGQMDFGRISLRGQCGIYVFRNAALIHSHPYYFKLTTLVYVLAKTSKISPYLGVQLKSHAAVAQYLALLAGITLR